jgi:hypothetical protein
VLLPTRRPSRCHQGPKICPPAVGRREAPTARTPIKTKISASKARSLRKSECARCQSAPCHRQQHKDLPPSAAQRQICVIFFSFHFDSRALMHSIKSITRSPNRTPNKSLAHPTVASLVMRTQKMFCARAFAVCKPRKPPLFRRSQLWFQFKRSAVKLEQRPEILPRPYAMTQLPLVLHLR